MNGISKSLGFILLEALKFGNSQIQLQELDSKYKSFSY